METCKIVNLRYAFVNKRSKRNQVSLVNENRITAGHDIGE